MDWRERESSVVIGTLCRGRRRFEEQLREKLRSRPPHSEDPGASPRLYTRVTDRVTCPASTVRQGSDCCSVREGGAGGAGGRAGDAPEGEGIGEGVGEGVGRTASAVISLLRPSAADQSRSQVHLCHGAAWWGYVWLICPISLSFDYLSVWGERFPSLGDLVAQGSSAAPEPNHSLARTGKYSADM